VPKQILKSERLHTEKVENSEKDGTAHPLPYFPITWKVVNNPPLGISSISTSYGSLAFRAFSITAPFPKK